MWLVGVGNFSGGNMCMGADLSRYILIGLLSGGTNVSYKSYASSDWTFNSIAEDL